MNFPVSDARLEYIPHTFVTLQDKQLDIADKMLVDLERVNGVVKVYHNIQSVNDQ